MNLKITVEKSEKDQPCLTKDTQVYLSGHHKLWDLIEAVRECELNIESFYIKPKFNRKTNQLEG